jgi:hypothetical protein
MLALVTLFEVMVRVAGGRRGPGVEALHEGADVSPYHRIRRKRAEDRTKEGEEARVATVVRDVEAEQTLRAGRIGEAHLLIIARNCGMKSAALAKPAQE